LEIHFKNDKYLKIDNKPVFVIGDSEYISNTEILYDVLNKLSKEAIEAIPKSIFMYLWNFGGLED
jgi:hypothetical protein